MEVEAEEEVPLFPTQGGNDKEERSLLGHNKSKRQSKYWYIEL